MLVSALRRTEDSDRETGRPAFLDLNWSQEDLTGSLLIMVFILSESELKL